MKHEPMQIAGTLTAQPTNDPQNPVEMLIHYKDYDGQPQQVPLKYSQYGIAQQLLDHNLLRQQVYAATKRLPASELEFTLPIYAEIIMVDILGNKIPVARMHRKQFVSSLMN